MASFETVNGIELNDEFRQALSIMENSESHAFITGRAGTGKSTLLEYFRNTTGKEIAVLAPTGVAAVNVRGQTIHSFFGFRPDIALAKVKRLSGSGRQLYRQLDAVVIDEASMVRADLLDCVDKFLRLNGKDEKKPFGGIQMVFIGDLHQLAPVVSGENTAITDSYESPYFFDSKSFGQIKPEFVELEKIYRQKDERFIGLLNAIRNNKATDADFRLLNTRLDPEFEPDAGSPCITLTPTNKAAEEINGSRLARLPGKAVSFKGTVKGGFNPNSLPTSADLKLKEGARVMLLNNDSAGRWVNGTLGKITGFYDDEEDEAVEVKLDGGGTEIVKRYRWDAFSYFFNPATGSIDSKSNGSFTQYPLKLAWAVTIHKSQGKTFDNVLIDIGRGTFAPGQTYVALSRCRTLEGITLKKPIERKHVFTDWRAAKFVSSCHYRKSDESVPLDAKIAKLKEAAKTRMPVEITYLKPDGTKSRRTILPKTVGKMEFQGSPYVGTCAYCFSRREDRNFRVDRILQIGKQATAGKTTTSAKKGRKRER